MSTSEFKKKPQNHSVNQEFKKEFILSIPSIEAVKKATEESIKANIEVLNILAKK